MIALFLAADFYFASSSLISYFSLISLSPLSASQFYDLLSS